jgi:hypothetical protein
MTPKNIPENIPNEFERGDAEYEIAPERFGWIPTPPDELAAMQAAAPFEVLELAIPLTLEDPLPYPKRVDGQDVIGAYDQIGGTCVGASGAQATTGRHELRSPGAGKKFDYIALYCECRRLMGDSKCNKNQGATMPSVAKALRDWGGRQIVGGVSQPANKDNGIASFSFGYNTESIRTAIGNGIYVQIGIAIYQAFMSPKLIRDPVTGKDEWWVYWQTGSWGSFLGGHAMVTFYWSDRRDAFWLPNTWGYSWCQGKGAWMSRAAFTRLLGAAMPAEVLICVDRHAAPPGPVGKLELAEPFAISPAAPKVGDQISVHLKVKNTGEGRLTGISLAIEDMVDGAGGDGFGFTPVFDLEPGAVYDHNPLRPDLLTAGHWRFRGDYRSPDGVYHVLGVVEVDVSGDEPPPPPPAEIMTIREQITIEGKTYSTDADQPDGVIYRRVN